MANSDPKKREIELQPDAWERFERAVAVVAKSPPQHTGCGSIAKRLRRVESADVGS
jgi:hypothetical protein